MMRGRIAGERGGGRLLLYTVGADLFASSLDDLREVIDVPIAGGPAAPVVMHGHRLDVRSLAEILGTPESGGGIAEERPLLVVEAEPAWIGFCATSVQGMLASTPVLPVPDGLSTLPPGCIVGAIRLEGGATLGDRLAAVASASAITLDAEPARADERIVLVLDLGKLAAGAPEEE